MSLPTLNSMINSSGAPQQIPASGSLNNQQGGYAQGGQYQTTPQSLNNWQQEMYNFQTHYQVTIPQNEIDNSFEDAKRNNRRYKFKDAETNYVKYSNDGKSYITIADASSWAHKNNPQYWGSQVNLPNSYEGKTSRLKNVCYIDTHFQFHHVKPGNYKLYINHGFEGQGLLNKLNLKVFVGDKEVYVLNDYPNQEMIGLKPLTETYICDILSNQFDTSKLDQNGDAVVKVCFAGKEGSWKKGWLIDGARLLAY